MRVTNNITQGRYLSSNNRAQTNMLKSYTRIMTQRKFNRVSEDPINGSKAMIIRRQLRDIDIYRDNLSTSKELFNAAETNLSKVAHDLYISVEEQLTAAGNGTHDDMELKIYTTSLEQTAAEMVDTLNGDFSERQIFGGTNNSVTPFGMNCVVVKDEEGNVMYPPYYDRYYKADGSLKDGVNFSDIPKNVTYNDVPVDFNAIGDMVFADGTVGSLQSGKYSIYVYKDVSDIGNDKNKPIEIDIDVTAAVANRDNSLIFPGSKPIYVDIGLGIKYDENYEVDPQTALDISLNGAAITGSGVSFSEEWVKNNIEVGEDGKRRVKDTEIYVTAEKAMKEYGVKTVEELEALGIETKVEHRVVDSESKTHLEEADVTLYKVVTKNLSGIFSNNLMQLTFDASAALKDGGYNSTTTNFDYDKTQNTTNGDQAYINGVIDRANLANRGVLTSITTLGSKQSSIEFYETKMDSYEYNLDERQNLVEGTDMYEEISNYWNIKAAYEAWLKIGTQVIPNSIFNFI